MRTLILAAAAALTLAGSAVAENQTIPGRIELPYPTLTNLAVEWEIKGDDNLDGVVQVAFRAAGESAWRAAMPLVRIPGDNTRDRTWPTYRWPNMHAGSVFDLRPDTEYQLRLSLRDPDGGRADTIVTARTRPVPAPAPDAVVRRCTPVTFRDSLLTARPGDILLLSPGYYGDLTLQRGGKPGRPLVIRSDRSHDLINATFDSAALPVSHVILEGVTVMGTVNLRHAEDVTVRRCTVHARYGIVAQQQPGAKNCYIADNTVSWVMPWTLEGTGSSSPYGGAANQGEGIELTGPGNVICYNQVSGYRDCISTMEDLWVYDQRCVDIYNNEIAVGPDDGIEADFCMANCRIMRNRITNCGMGLSSQPGLGGPVYFIRNAMYNISNAPYKLERLSYGNLFLHNSSVRAGDGFFEHHGLREYFRNDFFNNLSMAGPADQKKGRYSGGPGLAVNLPGFSLRQGSRFDYNAIGVHQVPFAGVIGRDKFQSLEQLRQLSGGPHSIQVDLSTFAAPVELPLPMFIVREPADLRLAPGSPAVDAALLLPNLNDDFTGQGPDIGAYELGKPIPHYGPRPEGVDEELYWQQP